MLTLRALRTPLLQILRVGLVFALLGVVAGIGQDPERLIWHAILSFCMHALVAIVVAAPVLGVMVIYRRIRLRRLSARIRRDLGV